MIERQLSVVRWLNAACLATTFVLAGAASASAQNVTVSIPGAEAFIVPNVQVSAAGTTSLTITWSTNGNFQGNHLRISVQADAANFTAPSAGRSPIAVNKASWTVASATNGTGSSGTVSSTAYTAVYNSGNGKKSGSVTLNWTLAALGADLRSGTHHVTLRWRLESVP
jgi:hypothetical protein